MKVVDLLDHVPMEDRDTKGDIYEYMLAKIATAGQNGQFCTPRHIIRLMVELTAPTPTDVICDPACGTAGFLVVAGEYLRARYSNLLHDPKLREHFHHRMFHGFDFDNTMLRKGWMPAKQVLRSATSVGANYRSAQWAKSKADFIAKLAVAEEEADETCYWLELIVEAELLPRERVEPLLREAMEITAMLTAAGKTAKQNK